MTDTAKEHMVMEHLVTLTYHERLTENLNRYADNLLEGRIIGAKCPSCGRVFVPSKGYCSLCVVPTTEADELELPDTGIVTGFTIIAPVNYYGQKKTEPFVYASVLLDGADTTLGGMDITGVAHSDLRSGMRVKAKWKPRGERSVEAMSNRGWGGFGDVVESFEATGEPDADEEAFKEHLF
ncbi:MAG: Zn-ribbon domain-containing OB-fold protein [Actinomycetota bacterium]|nr:Zn-ribbon domain-containing OB-fold protein [Actinomycetota bacterium]